MQNHLVTLQKDIVDQYALGKSNLCDVLSFKSWTPRVRVDNLEKSLTKEGQRELLALGQRLKNRFPTLLNQKFKNETFFVSLIDFYFNIIIIFFITMIQLLTLDSFGMCNSMPSAHPVECLLSAE
jgi:hypothetical protein